MALTAGIARLSRRLSKTGDPECSAAMSAWVRGRRTGGVSAAVYAILGKCRAKARAMLGTNRQEKAARDAKAAARKQVRAQRQTKTGLFALRQESAIGPRAKTFGLSNTGAGKTGTLFDLGKTGELRGQTTLMDRFGTVGTHEGVSQKPFAQAVLDAAKRIGPSKGFGLNGEKVLIHDVFHEFSKTPQGKIMSLAEFKQRITADGETRLALGLGRHDMPHAGPPLAEQEKASTKYMGAEFHHIRIPKGGAVSRQTSRQMPAPRPAPEIHRDWAGRGELKPVKQRFGPHLIGPGGPSRFATSLSVSAPPRPSPAKYAVTYGKAAPAGPMEAIQAVRAHQQKAFGASLFNGPRLKPEQALERGRNLVEARARTAGKLLVLRAAQVEQKSPAAHGQVGKTYDIPVKDIHFDPERFQYKLSAQGAHGTTEALKDVTKWDPELAGTVSVWRDPANGKTYVVNGHHRLDLAARKGVEKISGRLIHAKTAEEARAKGALVNIAEGRGTATDAAKFFRDTGLNAQAVREKGVSLKEHTAAQGLAMSGLEPKAFQRLVAGELSPARAAIIGGSGLSHPQQAQLLKVLDKPKNAKLTDGTVRNMVDAAKAAGSHQVTTHDLFGSDEHEESLFIHRAAVEDHIQRTLTGDKKLFSLVSKSKAAEALAERGRSTIDVETTHQVGREAAGVLGLFNQVKNRDPQISRPLNDAAERIAKGENAKTVQTEVRKQVTARIKAILEGTANPFE